MKPIILLSGTTSTAPNGTPVWALNQDYAECVKRAGGVPLLAVNADCVREYAELADGLLLSGGKDVSTDLYGQEQKYDSVITDPQRDDLEWKLAKAFIECGKPVFGICRGIQVLNAYFGGTLWQDIPDQLGGDHSKGVCHAVALKKDSILGSLYGESLETNSYHHQAIDRMAECLTATAWSDAGGHKIVEAIEHKSLPIWAVQWHPERMTGPVTNPKNCTDSLPIFEYFVNQCRK